MRKNIRNRITKLFLLMSISFVVFISCFVFLLISANNQVKDEMKIIGMLRIQDEKWRLETVSSEIRLISNSGERVISTVLNGRIIDSCIADMNEDGRDEFLIIEGKEKGDYGEALAIYDSELKLLLRQSFTNMNPWKVQTCDVDGDGEKEISIGVYKKSEFHPIMAKRPFIYNYHDNSISPKWRGSRLARPFEDYIFADIDGDQKDEIIAIEILEDGQNVINTYGWKGFGFEGKGESRAFQKITAVQKGSLLEGKWMIEGEIETDSGLQWIVIQYDDGKLMEVNKK